VTIRAAFAAAADFSRNPCEDAGDAFIQERTKMKTTKGVCKGCGRILILEEGGPNGLVSRHEAPLCAQYEALIENMKKERLPDLEVGPDGYPKRPS
jgi:hypothetical protein